MLVFCQAGLYAPRERRPGAGRIVSSLVLVALIVLAFGLGTSYDFTTTGLIPTAVVTCALAIGLLRAAYDSVALELLNVAGVRRRVVLVGAGEGLERLQRELARLPRRHRLRVRRCRRPGRRARACRCSDSSLDDLPDILEHGSPGRADPGRGRLRRAHRCSTSSSARTARASGCASRRDTTELLVREGEYVPGQGVPLFELQPAGPRRLGLGAEAGVRPRRSAPLLIVLGLPLWLLVALAIKLDSRGPVFYVDRRIGVGEREFGMLKFRTMVARRGATSRTQLEEDERGVGGALQDPRRPARDARRPRAAPALARRDAADRQRRCAAR